MRRMSSEMHCFGLGEMHNKGSWFICKSILSGVRHHSQLNILIMIYLTNHNWGWSHPWQLSGTPSEQACGFQRNGEWVNESINQWREAGVKSFVKTKSNKPIYKYVNPAFAKDISRSNSTSPEQVRITSALCFSIRGDTIFLELK